MITCSEAVKQLWDYVERSLPVEEELQIDEHVAVCRQCCGEADFAGELRGFLGAQTRGDIPPDARERLESFLVILDGGESPWAT